MAEPTPSVSRLSDLWHRFEHLFEIDGRWPDAAPITNWALGIVNDPIYGPADASGIHAQTTQNQRTLQVTLFVRADQQNIDWGAVHTPTLERVDDATMVVSKCGFARIGFIYGEARGYTLGLERPGIEVDG